jgi:8-oxo-dGTP pyrophosphatase MutT (NUDIX family)
LKLVERLRASLERADVPAPAGASIVRGDWDFDLGTDRRDRFTPAAVLVPIVRRSEPTVLLTRRTDTLRSHAGQVAFPGGRIDPGEDAVTAALREAMEEVALPPEEVEVIGCADDYETGSGYRITPIVGLIPPDLPLVPAESEVAAVFEVPLAHLLDSRNHRLEVAVWQGRDRRYWEIDWATHRIWGVTAGMIVNLSRRIAA